MKRINGNLIVLMLSLVIIIVGLCSPKMFSTLKSNVYELVFNTKNNSFSERIDLFISGIEDSANNVLYHDNCLDLNSYIYNKTNRKAVEKSDETVIKLNNEYLDTPKQYISDDEIDLVTYRIKELSVAANKNGADFLYVMCPQKGLLVDSPSFIDNYAKSNYDRYCLAMKNEGIPMLDLKDKMIEDELNEEKAFFITDHHWKPNTGFWAYGKICESLSENYGFEYDKDYTDISNYDINTYEDWFLGSQGKKVGKYYSDLGIDDIDIITPKFSTNLTVEDPIKDEVRTGEFKDSVLFMEKVNKKDLYKLSPYGAYSGGNFSLQIFKNNINKDGKTFVIVRDSFSCPVVPFLALQASELHLIDVRQGLGFTEKINVFDYIEKINPDYVLVIYFGATTVSDSSEKYNFN